MTNFLSDLEKAGFKESKAVDIKRECNKNAEAEIELIMIDFAYLPHEIAN